MLKRTLPAATLLAAAAATIGSLPAAGKDTVADDLRWVATGGEPTVTFNGRFVVYEASKGGTTVLGVRDMKGGQSGVGKVGFRRRFPSVGDTVFALAWQEIHGERDPLCDFRDYWLVHVDDEVVVSKQSRFLGAQLAGAYADGSCEHPVISGDGSHVAFEGRAGNLAPGVENAEGCNPVQLYLRDGVNQRTQLASKNAAGVAGNGASRSAAVSRTGRFVAFESFADNLVPDDRDGIPDVFLFDSFTGELTLVSHADGSATPVGGTKPAISADGRYVAYTGKAPPEVSTTGTSVYVFDTVSRTREIVSRAPGANGAPLEARDPSISADGRFVSFVTLSGDATSEGLAFVSYQAVVRDRTTGENRLATREQGPAGAPLEGEGGVLGVPRLSGDGRYLVFVTRSDTFTKFGRKGVGDIFARDVWGPTGASTDLKPPKVKKLGGSASIQAPADCAGTPPALGTIDVTASEAATLIVRFLRAVDNRLEEEGRVTQEVPAGLTQVPVTGCIGEEILPQGDYYVHATLIDAGLNVSKPKVRKFRID